MGDLMELASRIEAARKGSRRLDIAIHRAAFKVNGFIFRVPRYSTSIDAAMRLVQKGLLPGVHQHAPDRWGACITKPYCWDCGTMAYTAALALCAAALRALASGGDHGR